MYIFGKNSGLLSTVAVVAALIGGTSNAQSLRNSNGPAEVPPSSFSSNQYIDSRGCVFVRAGIGGTTNWVPRVSRSREQLCGFQPSGSTGTTVAQAPQEAPAPTQAPAPAPVVAAAPAPAPAVPTPTPAPAIRPAVVAAAPAPNVVRPTTTRAPITPQIGQPASVTTPRPVQTAAQSPRVITAPAVEPRTITRAQACDGLTGVQPNFVSQRTGQPIDCGNAPTPQVAAVAPRPAAQAPAVQAPAAQSRLTRSQACADMASSGRQYISAITGLPVQCAPQSAPSTQGTFARLQADLALPQRAYSNPLDAAPGSTFTPTRTQTRVVSNRIPYSNPLDSAPSSTFTPNMNTRDVSLCSFATAVGNNEYCGPQAATPSANASNPEIVSRARSSVSTQGFVANLINQDPPPYSNPTNSYALPAPVVPDGYTRVWGDGRLNTQRGIPAGSYNQSPSTNRVQYATAPRAPQAAVQQPRVATPAVAPQPQRSEQISGHRYVQVGTFETRNQAQSIAQSLRSRGLPMRIGVFNQNGREMRIVLAGPFGSDSQLQGALGTARGAGYSGAFTRR